MAKKEKEIRVECGYGPPHIMDDILQLHDGELRGYVNGYSTVWKSTKFGNDLVSTEHRLSLNRCCNKKDCKKKAKWVGFTYIENSKVDRVYALYKCPLHEEQRDRLVPEHISHG